MRTICWTRALLITILNIGCGAGEDLLLGAKPAAGSPLKESAGEDQPGGQSSDVSKTKEKPFHFEGPWQAEIQTQPRCPQGPRYGGLVMNSESDVPHLGHTVLTASVCNDGATHYWFNGKAVFTAANGDTINAAWPFAESGFLSWEPLLWVYWGDMYIIGGTGRFQNASGVLNATIFITEGDLRGTQIVEGTFSY